LSTYPDNNEANQLKDFASKILDSQIQDVLSGNNKEVEKRYKYYVC